MKKILLILISFSAIISVNLAYAETVNEYDLKLVVPFGGLPESVPSPAVYIQTIFKWGIGFAALAAMLFLTFGAVEYTLSAGNIASQENAKSRIRAALYGLALLLGSVLILTTINPTLTNLTLPDPTVVEKKNSDQELKKTYEEQLRAYNKGLYDAWVFQQVQAQNRLGTIPSAQHEADVALADMLSAGLSNEARASMLAGFERRIQNHEPPFNQKVASNLPGSTLDVGEDAMRFVIGELHQALSPQDFIATLYYIDGGYDINKPNDGWYGDVQRGTATTDGHVNLGNLEKVPKTSP
jgi:hypothetical protein